MNLYILKLSDNLLLATLTHTKNLLDLIKVIVRKKIVWPFKAQEKSLNCPYIERFVVVGVGQTTLDYFLHQWLIGYSGQFPVWVL